LLRIGAATSGVKVTGEEAPPTMLSNSVEKKTDSKERLRTGVEMPIEQCYTLSTVCQHPRTAGVEVLPATLEGGYSLSRSFFRMGSIFSRSTRMSLSLAWMSRE
jgi:hypothetical protein